MKHIKSIYEYRYQLEIPFDGKHPLHGKPVHQHLLDALEELGNKEDPENYWSDQSIEELWDKNYEDAKKLYMNSGDDFSYDVIDEFLRKFPLSRFPEYYNVNPDDYKNDESFNRDVQDNITNYLTNEGEEAINLIYDESFDDRLDEYDAKWNMEKNQDDNGLILIYRAISFHKGNSKDEFENIVNHGGVGIFWSWSEDGAEPHGGGMGKTLILYGKVKPEYVNWESTIFKSAWNLNEEKEVELNGYDNVLIYAISDYRDTSKKIYIEPPKIVPM